MLDENSAYYADDVDDYPRARALFFSSTEVFMILLLVKVCWGRVCFITNRVVHNAGR
jgi:hypothetical protein